MLKKFTNNAHAVKEWWMNESHSLWKKMSCGAAQIARMRPRNHGEQWRGQNKHQKNHKKS